MIATVFATMMDEPAKSWMSGVAVGLGLSVELAVAVRVGVLLGDGGVPSVGVSGGVEVTVGVPIGVEVELGVDVTAAVPLTVAVAVAASVPVGVAPAPVALGGGTLCVWLGVGVGPPGVIVTHGQRHGNGGPQSERTEPSEQGCSSKHAPHANAGQLARIVGQGTHSSAQ